MTSCIIARVLFVTLPLVALLPYMGDCRHFRPVWSRTSKRVIEPETEIYSPYEMVEDDGFKRRFEGLSENELEMAREIEDKLERAQQRQQEEGDEEAVRKRNYWDDDEDEDEDEYEDDIERPLEAEEEEEEKDEEGNKKKRMLGNWNQMKHYPHRLHNTH